MTNGLKGFIDSSIQRTTTLEGGNAYGLSLEEQLCHIFTLGLIRGNFYKDKEKVVSETRGVLERALREMPYVATQYAVYAAEQLGMKLLPVIWLVYVSTLDDKTLFKAAFPRIINNPKTLYDFTELCRKAGIRPGFNGNKNGMGQGVKKTINKWLYDNLNEYNVTRYTGKLEDVVRMTRPLDKIVIREGDHGPYEVNIGDYLRYIFKPRDGDRRLTFPRALAQDRVVRNLQNGTVDDETLDLIKRYRFQLEELKFTFGGLDPESKRTVFRYFVPHLRYNALVSNLVTIERAFATRLRKVRKLDPESGRPYNTTEVMETEIPRELIDTVAGRLRDFNEFKASKMLYFGLLTAHEMTIIPEWRQALQDVLRRAGRVAFRDVPQGVRVRVGADTSGSMINTPITNSLKAVDVASYLAAGITLSIPGSRTYAVATYSNEVRLIGDDLIQNAERIKKMDVGWGTNFETLLADYDGEDYIVLVTDGQDSGNMERKWERLASRPKGAKLIVWHVAGHTYFNKISRRSDVIYLKGYSDQILSVLANVLAGRAGQPDVVRSIQL